MKMNIFGGAQLYKNKTEDTVSRGCIHCPQFPETVEVLSNRCGLYYLRVPLSSVCGIGIPFATSQAGDAIIGLVGFKTNSVHIGYSYDFTISNLLTTTGVHEISIIYEFNNLSVGRQRARIRRFLVRILILFPYGLLPVVSS